MAYTQIDLDGLKAIVAQKWGATPFWSDDDATDAINEAILVWQSYTMTWKARIVLTLNPSSRFVALPATLSRVARVEVNGTTINPTTIDGLQNAKPSWASDTTTTTGCPAQVAAWAPLGLYMLAIWPLNETANAASLTVDGVSAPPTLANNGDYLDLPLSDVGPITDMALHVLLFDQGAGRFDASTPYAMGFLEAAKARNSLIAALDVTHQSEGADNSRFTNPPDMTNVRGVPGQQA